MTLAHRAIGQGPPVVLLHGFCETHEIWNRFLPLADEFHLLIPDLPGFGNSALLPTPFSINDVASKVWAWLRSMNILSPVIVGHSLGGYVTLAMTHQSPEDVKGFCLFHSTAKADTEEKKANRNKVMAFVSKNGVAPYIDTFVPGLFFRKDDPAMTEVYKIANGTRQDTLLAYAEAMRDRPDRTDVLSTFQGPILLVAGEKDDIIPLDTLMPQAVMPADGHLTILSGTGHMGMYESEARSREAVRRFLVSCHGN